MRAKAAELQDGVDTRKLELQRAQRQLDEAKEALEKEKAKDAKRARTQEVTAPHARRTRHTAPHCAGRFAFPSPVPPCKSGRFPSMVKERAPTLPIRVNGSTPQCVSCRAPRRRVRRRVPAAQRHAVHARPCADQPGRAPRRPVQPRTRRGVLGRRRVARPRPRQPQRHAPQRRTAPHRPPAAPARRGARRPHAAGVRGRDWASCRPAEGRRAPAEKADGLEIRKRLGQTRYQQHHADDEATDTETVTLEARVAPQQAVAVLYRLALDMAAAADTDGTLRAGGGRGVPRDAGRGRGRPRAEGGARTRAASSTASAGGGPATYHKVSQFVSQRGAVDASRRCWPRTSPPTAC